MEWVDEAVGLETQTIHTHSLPRSASNITFERFLLLRVLWRPAPKMNQLDTPTKRKNYINKNTYEIAEQSLAQLPGWQRYVESFNTTIDKLRDGGWDGLDMFVLAREYQARIGDLRQRGEDAIPKVDFTPVAMRTRHRLQIPGRGGPLSHHETPSKSSGHSAVDLDCGDEDELDETDPHGDEELPPILTLRRNLGAATRASMAATRLAATRAAATEAANANQTFSTPLAREFAGLSISKTPASRHPLSALSPYTGDISRDTKTQTDEQVVNSALLTLLDCLTMRCPGIKTKWSCERAAFTVRNGEGDKVYEARVDGVLRHRISDKILGIIEVKPFQRTSTPSSAKAIRMQEGAQIAAWISQEPPTAGEMEAARLRPTESFKYVLVSFFSSPRPSLLPSYHQFPDNFLFSFAWKWGNKGQKKEKREIKRENKGSGLGRSAN